MQLPGSQDEEDSGVQFGVDERPPRKSRGGSVVRTPGAVGLDIREDWPLGWAGRRSTFCPVGKEEGLCRQREQQVQRGSVKGPGMSGGGEKFRDNKARTRVCACVRACWETTRGWNGERQGIRPKSEPLLFSLKRRAVLYTCTYCICPAEICLALFRKFIPLQPKELLNLSQESPACVLGLQCSQVFDVPR